MHDLLGTSPGGNVEQLTPQQLREAGLKLITERARALTRLEVKMRKARKTEADFAEAYAHAKRMLRLAVEAVQPELPFSVEGADDKLNPKTP